jgi:hypothetical protein
VTITDATVRRAERFVAPIKRRRAAISLAPAPPQQLRTEHLGEAFLGRRHAALREYFALFICAPKRGRKARMGYLEICASVA